MSTNLDKLYDGIAKEYYSADEVGKKKILDQNWLHNDFTTSKKTGFGRFLSRCWLTRSIYMRNLRLAKTVEKLEKLVEKKEFFSAEEAEKAKAVRSLLKGYINKIGNKGEKTKLLDKMAKCFEETVVDNTVTNSGSSPAPVPSEPSSPATPEPAAPVLPIPALPATPEPVDPVVDDDVTSDGGTIAQDGEPLTPSVSLNQLLCSSEARDCFLADNPELRETVDVFVSELDADAIPSEYLEDFRIPMDVIEEMALLDDDERRNFVQRLSQLAFVSKETMEDLPLREINNPLGGLDCDDLGEKLVNFMLQAIGSRLEKFRTEQDSRIDLNAQWTEGEAICLGKFVQLSSEQLCKNLDLLFPLGFSCLSKEQFSGFNWEEIGPQNIMYLFNQSKQALDCFQELPVLVAQRVIFEDPRLSKYVTNDQLDGFNFSSFDRFAISRMMPEDGGETTARLFARIPADCVQELVCNNRLPYYLYQYVTDELFNGLDFSMLFIDQMSQLMPEDDGEKAVRRFARIPTDDVQDLILDDELPYYLYQYATDDRFDGFNFSSFDRFAIARMMPEDGGERTEGLFARIPTDDVQRLILDDELPYYLYQYVTDDRFDGFNFSSFDRFAIARMMPEDGGERTERLFARIPTDDVQRLILDDELPYYLYQYVTDELFNGLDFSKLSIDQMSQLMPEDDEARTARLFALIKASVVLKLFLDYKLPGYLGERVTADWVGSQEFEVIKADFSILMPSNGEEERTKRLLALIPPHNLQELLEKDELPDFACKQLTNDQFQRLDLTKLSKQTITKLMPGTGRFGELSARSMELSALIPKEVKDELRRKGKAPGHLVPHWIGL